MLKTFIFILAMLFSMNTRAQGISSPEPQESNYTRELNAANDSKSRGLALTKYVEAILDMGYAEAQKKQLIEKKVKAMIDLDFMGIHELFTKVNRRHLNFLITQVLPMLTSEQKAAFSAVTKYITDDFVSVQNNTTRPTWPANVPRPGYGWGKTVSSNKTTPAPEQSSGNAGAKPVLQVTENIAKKLLGTYWTYIDHGVDRVFKVMSFNNATLNYTVKATKLDRDTKAYSYICYTENKEIPAEDLLYVRPSSSYKPFTPQNNSTSCPACKGAGTRTQTFTHTNDYEYTLGTKTTYTSTSKVKCQACNGSGGSMTPDPVLQWLEKK